MRIHSLLNPKCSVGRSAVDGQGVFATARIEFDEVVAVWGGKVFSQAECESLSSEMPEFESHAIEICPGYWLGSQEHHQRDDAELFNHSCDPNIGIQGQIVLVARRVIQPGEELVIDYETLEARPQPFCCKCGSRNCRGELTGLSALDPAFQIRHQDYLSWQVERAIVAHRRQSSAVKNLPDYPPPETHK